MRDSEPLAYARSGAWPQLSGARIWIYESVKRLCDLVLSSLAILISLPVLTIIAVATKLESKGPILFSQERVGKDGFKFRVLKFRSMHVDAERFRAQMQASVEQSGPVFKLLHDPRVTRVGRILRRTSLDEFPQFFNVLLGQMSLVGPRPLPVRDVADWGRLPDEVRPKLVAEWLSSRHAVRPGITGLWQVSGRSLLLLQDWIKYDLQYVQTRSVCLDMKILARTPFVVFSGRGAV